MLIANPIQFVFEVACVFLFKYKVSKDSAKQNCILMFYQVMMVLFISYLTLQTTQMIMGQVSNGGRLSLVFFTFCFAWIVDQIKSFAVLSMVYVIIVRRCNYLKDNEKEFLPEDPES